MQAHTSATWTAFAGQRQIAAGDQLAMSTAVIGWFDAGGDQTRPVLVFNDDSGAQIDFNFSGTLAEVRDRLQAQQPPPAVDDVVAEHADEGPRRGPGRPKLGVISREVSLLPRHWQWLQEQPGGLSAALRRLVDEARKGDQSGVQQRRRQEAAGRFMWSMAGDLEGFEEASRALYANDRPRLLAQMTTWPADIATHVTRLLDR